VRLPAITHFVVAIRQFGCVDSGILILGLRRFFGWLIAEMKRRFQFLYLSLSLLSYGHVDPDSRPSSWKWHMSFETSKRRTVKSEQRSNVVPIPPDHRVSEESVLAPTAALENTLDSDALGRSGTLFELLDNWNQEGKAR
jgi:hypothetical protein